MISVKHIQELCETVALGPFRVGVRADGTAMVRDARTNIPFAECLHEDSAAFIASLDPQTMLAMLKVVRAAKECVNRILGPSAKCPDEAVDLLRDALKEFTE